MVKRIIWAAMILLVGAWVIIFSQETGAQELRLGAMSMLTGPGAQQGGEIRRGMDLAEIVQNERGGLLGKKVKLVWADAPSPKEGMAEAERLITTEKIDLIISGNGSPMVVAASEVANRHSVPFFEIEALSDPITEKAGKYFWRITCRSSDFARLAVEFAKEFTAPKLGIAPGKMRIAIVYEDGLYGTTTMDYINRYLPSAGLTNIVLKESYSQKSVDLSSMIMKVKSAKPDVLMAVSNLPDALLIMQQLKILKVNLKAIQGFGYGWGQPGLAESLGKDLDYVLNCDYPPPEINPTAVPGLEDVKKKYQTQFGQPLKGPHALTCYMETMVIFDIIKRAGSLEPEAIAKAAWETDIPTWSTPSGWGVKFVGPGKPHPGQNTRSFPYITQWMGKGQKVVWPSKATFGTPVLPMPTWEERAK